ncbi:MAG: type III secretion system chaperone [Puniceicoccales bacterium]|jgi:hypothetical protein|nr:type III secretion system chaperone [Puniceicoccales bacterium]
MNDLLKDFLTSLHMSQDEIAENLENNAFQIQLDNGCCIALEIDVKTGDIIFSSELAVIKEPYITRIALLLLQANLFWVGTNGGTLGFDKGTSTASLLDRVPANVDLQTFEARLTTFLETVTSWSTALEQLQQDEFSASGVNTTNLDLIPTTLRNLI